MSIYHFVLASWVALAATAFGAGPTSRLIDCHQNGDGFNDFTLQIVDATHAMLTVDTFHTPINKVLAVPDDGVRLARLTLTATDGFGLSTTDPLLASFIAEPSKVEFLDPFGKVLGTVDSPALSDVRLNAIHGKANLGGADFFNDADTVFYEIEISNKPAAGEKFKTAVGRHWLILGNVIICKTN